VCLALARYPAFRTADNLSAVAENAAFIGIMACGQAFVILAGGIDLSVGSLLALSACGAAVCLERGMAVPVAMLAGIALGTLGGLINGLLVTYRRLPPILTTLATLLLFRHGISILTHSRNFGPFPDTFNRISSGWTPAVLLLVITGITALIQSRTRWGRWTVALGNGEQAARLAGIPVAKVRVAGFMLSGFCAGLAGLIVMAFNNNAQSSIAQGYELNVIAACVVGGIRITGGEGSVVGGVLGAVLMALLPNWLILIQKPADQYGVFTGAVILIAALMEGWRQRNAERRRQAAAIHGTEAAAS
jgi:ribose transport system permease protein